MNKELNNDVDDDDDNNKCKFNRSSDYPNQISAVISLSCHGNS
jgi:hypothetical protein